MLTSPPVQQRAYRDRYGNTCRRFLAPAGRFSILYDAVIEDSGEPDPVNMLAKALELSQYQLLIPDLDPRNPQVVKGATLDEQALYRKIAMEAVKEALAETTPGLPKLSRNQR